MTIGLGLGIIAAQIGALTVFKMPFDRMPFSPKTTTLIVVGSVGTYGYLAWRLFESMEAGALVAVAYCAGVCLGFVGNALQGMVVNHTNNKSK